MMEFEAKVRKWGNSLAVVLPHSEARTNRVKTNEIMHVIVVRKCGALRKSFGRLPSMRSAQEIKDELRKELYD